MKLYIARSKEVNPLINAMREDRFEAALKEAEAVDELVATLNVEKLEKSYPLLGVPFTMKEHIGVQG